jgi:acetyl esterase/lipase
MAAVDDGGSYWRRRAILTLVLGGLLTGLWTVEARKDPHAPAVGTILSRKPYLPTVTYDEWFAKVFASGRKDDPRDPDVKLERVRAYYTRDLFDALAQAKDVEAERLTYLSDGLKVHGFLVRPKGAPGTFPVILWCRGGSRDYGAIKLGDLLVMSNWARRGYIVLASNYRGTAGGEGHDELGGGDVHDVEALIPLARSLPDVDPGNIFLYGQSRGGLMVYRALADGVDVQAAVVNSGLSDLKAELKARPEMEEEFRATMPGAGRGRIRTRRRELVRRLLAGLLALSVQLESAPGGLGRSRSGELKDRGAVDPYGRVGTVGERRIGRGVHV